MLENNQKTIENSPIMTFIVYCNSCFETKSKLKGKYFVTSCGHVFCDVCLEIDASVCKLCNEECRVLKINKDLPPEVKVMFEPGSVPKLIESIKKIRTFQENQARLYHEKMRSTTESYPKSKQYLQKLFSVKKRYSEAVKKEKQIINRLKAAFQTKLITPDLFKISSQMAKDDNILSPRREGSLASHASSQSRSPNIHKNNSPKTMLTPVNRTYGAASAFYPPSTPRLSASRLSSLVQTFRPSSVSGYLVAPSNSNSLFSLGNPLHFRSTTSSIYSRVANQGIKPLLQRNTQLEPIQLRDNVMMGTRDALLKNTLRQMNAESQQKSQSIRRSTAKGLSQDV